MSVLHIADTPPVASSCAALRSRGQLATMARGRGREILASLLAAALIAYCTFVANVERSPAGLVVPDAAITTHGSHGDKP